MQTRNKVLLGLFIYQLTVAGLLFSFGLFFTPLQDEFGWSRATLSSATATAFFLMGPFAVVAGRLNDSWRPNVLLSISGLTFGLGYLWISQVSYVWQLYAALGLCVALGLGANEVVTLSTVASWFQERRGLYSGIVKTGAAIGQVLVPPLAAFLLVSFGWRTALLVLSLGTTAILIAAAATMKKNEELSSTGTVLAEAVTSPNRVKFTATLAILCGLQFTFFPAATSLPTHLAAHGIDLGLTTSTSALLLSIIGAASLLGRLSMGWLADRLGNKMAVQTCFLTLIAALIALSITRQGNTLFWIVALYGVSHGGFFTIMSPLVAEHFGMRRHGSIFGLTLLFGTLGGTIGPILVGWIYDVQGSYNLAFEALAAISTLGFALSIALPNNSSVRWTNKT